MQPSTLSKLQPILLDILQLCPQFHQASCHGSRDLTPCAHDASTNPIHACIPLPSNQLVCIGYCTAMQLQVMLVHRNGTPHSVMPKASSTGALPSLSTSPGGSAGAKPLPKYLSYTCTGAPRLRLAATYFPGVHPTGPYHKGVKASYHSQVRPLGGHQHICMPIQTLLSAAIGHLCNCAMVSAVP